ncbi:Serine carboxypeptidase-like 6 [Nymphaea thermarum]|nr:Serine carboxypeptidase-like 6 [Nymphaea thermarum]
MAQFCYSFVLSFACLLLLGVSRHASGEERVATLPGYDGDLPFEMYTGYITVNETTSNNIFYYFIKSERNSTTDPLILWLTGGPGCSGFSGLVFEIEQIASIIFIDSPTFTGFSYSNSTDDHFTGNSKNFEEDYVFLKKWLEQHPEFQSNPLYIAGDSYAGMIIPALTYRIAKEMEDGAETIFNLKGYFEGNPTTDNNFDASAVPFVHGMSLIPTSLYEETKKICNGQYYDPPNENCTSHLELIDELIAEVNQPHILEVYCGYIWSPEQRLRLASRRAVYEFESIHHYPSNVPPISCRVREQWVNGKDAAKSSSTTRNGRASYTTIVLSSPKATLLFSTGYLPSLSVSLSLSFSLTCDELFSGDHDMVVSHVGTQGWIGSLNFTVAEKWRPWFVENQVAGYTRKYAPNITYATVKGAGHTAPEYRPKECFHMYERWLSGKAL